MAVQAEADSNPLALEWFDENNGTIAGIPFRVVREKFNEEKTTDSEIVVLKGRSFFENYVNLISAAPRTVLEVGIFEGGSAFIFAAMWPMAKIVGIDLRKPNDAVRRHIDRMGLQDRVQLHYGISQTDKAAITAISVADDIDLIIDDASHSYDFSLKTFEITYPRLTPGGAYVLEDWGWAHWQSWKMFSHYDGQPALSNLVWEVTMAAATSPKVIGSVTVNVHLAIFRKPKTCGPLASDFTLANIYTARGKNLEVLI